MATIEVVALDAHDTVMLVPRHDLHRQLGAPGGVGMRLLAVAFLLVLAAVGCDTGQLPAGPTIPPDIAPDVAAAICRVRASAGDSDCDAIADTHDRYPGFNDFQQDADSDGAPDPIDRYLGDDFGDDDGDGWSNFVDPSPTGGPLTIADMIRASRPEEQQVYAQQQVVETARENGLVEAGMVSGLEVVVTMMDVPGDDDGDGMLNQFDTQSGLDAYDDYDADGESNWSDLYPTDPGGY